MCSLMFGLPMWSRMNGTSGHCRTSSIVFGQLRWSMQMSNERPYSASSCTPRTKPGWRQKSRSGSPWMRRRMPLTMRADSPPARRGRRAPGRRTPAAPRRRCPGCAGPPPRAPRPTAPPAARRPARPRPGGRPSPRSRGPRCARGTRPARRACSSSGVAVEPAHAEVGRVPEVQVRVDDRNVGHGLLLALRAWQPSLSDRRRPVATRMVEQVKRRPQHNISASARQDRPIRPCPCADNLNSKR